MVGRAGCASQGSLTLLRNEVRVWELPVNDFTDSIQFPFQIAQPAVDASEPRVPEEPCADSDTRREQQEEEQGTPSRAVLGSPLFIGCMGAAGAVVVAVTFAVLRQPAGMTDAEVEAEKQAARLQRRLSAFKQRNATPAPSPPCSQPGTPNKVRGCCVGYSRRACGGFSTGMAITWWHIWLV